MEKVITYNEKGQKIIKVEKGQIINFIKWYIGGVKWVKQKKNIIKSIKMILGM
jgi:hypothetical protein